ncbi:ATP-grasp domain-containing protein [Nocardia vinacea]|uniref:ATP-grasp domain-containing protein n=1 Tax=Nocardia vinacea TaxID=96468 RepID=UPI0007C4394A|nr:ATP-grasp domain-containing protein [Nocardia vinacea]
MNSDGSRMPRRVLVTGIGGQPGFDLARRLLQLGCEVIGTDADPLANGLSLPGLTVRQSISSTDPRYDADLLRLCRDLRPHAMLSAVESELPQLLSLRARLSEMGVRTWLPPQRAIHACLDKAEFAAMLAEHGIPTSRTWLPHQIADIPDDCPLVVKPRHGQGSQNVVFCRTWQQALILCEVVPEPIVQARVDGREFTADCLVDRNGKASVILRYRLLTKGGLSMVSSTFHDPEVADAVAATLSAVGAVGLCCVQGFLRDDSPGRRVVMTEMNARVAGGFLLAEAAGADLIEQALAGLWGLRVDHDRLRYRPGVLLTKYVETLTVRDLAPVRHSSGTTHPQPFQFLAEGPSDDNF